MKTPLFVLVLGGAAMTAGLTSSVSTAAQRGAPAVASATPDAAFVKQYCATCHNPRLKVAQLDLESLNPAAPSGHAEVWEKVVRKVRTGMMPPNGAPRPDRAAMDKFASQLEDSIDRTAAASPNPGATMLHRLNRAEYANSVRDLLGLDLDVATLLPADDSAEGFDNIADVLGASPTLIQGYVTAAMKISRAALGDIDALPARVTYRTSSKEEVAAPAGTRSGLTIRHNFPLDAEYEITIAAGAAGGRGARGGTTPRAPDVVVTFDGALLPVANPRRFRLPIQAGPHTITASLVSRDSSAGVDEVYSVFSGGAGSVSSVLVAGPYNATGVGDTPARRRVLTCQPTQASQETACARKILASLAGKAFRRPVKETEDSVTTLVNFYQAGRDGGTFENGIQQAVARILVDPQFLFRFEKEPANVQPGKPYRLSGAELASRLSFFLWSSIPDQELIDAATAGRLSDPAVLERQVLRMLKDPKAQALVDNFASQWLYLRQIKNAMPDSEDFDGSLRAAFERETTMLFEAMMKEDRSIVDLLDADFTFVNERLARHYGIPNIRGDRFRRISLPADSNRRGLLGQGSILLVTSAANRTSPVTRGKWILENVLGAPPPAPPPGVEINIDAKTEDKQPPSLRQRMEQHRSNPVCSSCHTLMDPIGFALENFDLVGKWRERDGKTPINATGQLVDGTKLDGPASLRRALMARSDVFVTTTAEKLMTYAVGRAVNYADMPAIRAVVHESGRNNYRFSSLVLAIAKSQPFQTRVKKADARLAQVR